MPNICAIGIVTLDKKLLFFYFLFIIKACELDMHSGLKPYKQRMKGPYNDHFKE